MQSLPLRTVKQQNSPIPSNPSIRTPMPSEIDPKDSRRRSPQQGSVTPLPSAVASDLHIQYYGSAPTYL
ncbi:uncharacterized protein BDZ83DRAFT_242823 [Colletotrichum acutatum]|uniref:Uncharacterized protein n=1 Tax=Glomerella acutata TaxID=27357 RepID=A0AAD9D297_GLOAC|nr:uncharacterized protein BDZ83DRAFT_242823 [Colletotrichum acutatum]KAK1731213.1 hypothetical protein BDZ83DRAFT_242823 [Colletotrichum acutatum]